MPGSRDFGKIINERRLSLGYSLGQLANRMGTTATMVRSWERGDAVPDEESLGQLAEELNMSAGVLRATLPAAEPLLGDGGDEPTAAVAGPVFSDAADTASAELEDQTEDAADGVDLEKAPPADAGDDESDGADPTALVAATDLDGDNEPGDDGTSPADEGPEDEVDLVDLPTEAVPVVPSMPVFEPSGGLVAASAAVATAPPRVRIDPNELPIPEPSGFFAPVERLMAKVFDPDKQYLFWIRIALIVLIFFVFLRVLAWAVPEFFDTLKDILDTIESTPTEPEPSTGFISG